MSNYNWCHNPDCHTIATVSRIRGSKGNKVLRTVKIKVGRYNWNNDTNANIWDYFCNQNCLFQFLNKFLLRLLTHIQLSNQKKHQSKTLINLTLIVIIHNGI